VPTETPAVARAQKTISGCVFLRYEGQQLQFPRFDDIAKTLQGRGRKTGQGAAATEAISCAQGVRHIAAFMMRRVGCRSGTSGNRSAFYGKAAGLFSEDAFAMADKHALKLIGIMFAALTLMVISTAAVVVAGHAANSVSGQYLKLVDVRD